MSKDESAGMYAWSRQVPIFCNSTILGQLAVALGIPFGLLCAMLLVLGRGSIYTWYALGLVAALFLVTSLFIMLVYGGKYHVEYVLDSKGILSRTQPRQARKNRIVNSLTVGLGVLSGKPGAAGAGMLAASRQSVSLSWRRIRKVKYKPRGKVIIVRGGPMERIALFCGPDNYHEVERLLKSRLADNG